MINIPQSSAVYKVYVTKNATGFVFSGFFTFKDDHRVTCPVCGQPMIKDGFTQYKKIIYDFTINKRKPGINDVIVITTQKDGSQKITNGRDISDESLKTALITELRTNLYFKLQIVVCSNKNCLGKTDSGINEHHVLLPQYAVARHRITTDVLHEALKIKPCIDKYKKEHGLPPDATIPPGVLKKLLYSTKSRNHSNLFLQVRAVFGGATNFFLELFSSKSFQKLLQAAQIIVTAGPALINMFVSNMNRYCERDYSSVQNGNIANAETNVKKLTIEKLVVYNCSHFVRAASQRPKYSLIYFACKIGRVLRRIPP